MLMFIYQNLQMLSEGFIQTIWLVAILMVMNL